MIDIPNQQIVLAGKRYPIVTTTVWWSVPGRGLYPELRDALNDSPDGILYPSPVVIAENGIYELLPPELKC